MSVFHIRHKVPKRPRRWFLPRGPKPKPSTFCGARCTFVDAPWSWRNKVGPWDHPRAGHFAPCVRCMIAVAIEERS